jgi:hypothetical protein
MLRRTYFLSVKYLKKHRRPSTKTTKMTEKEILVSPRERMEWRITLLMSSDPVISQLITSLLRGGEEFVC